LNRGRVAIRLNLLPNSVACQTKDVQLGLYLPIPTSIKVELKHADKEKIGFLMAKAMKGQTKISFKVNDSSSKPKDTKSENSKLKEKEKESELITQSIAVTPLQPKLIEESVTKNSEITIFTVLAGHTLYDIGKRFGCTITDIANWNNLQRPYKIYVGQKLKIVTDKISQHKLVTASGINVRSSPKLKKNNVVDQLQFGTVVKQLSRTKNLARAGKFYNYWYKIETSDGKTSWIFGQYLSKFIPIQPDKRAQFYFKIAKKRIKKRLNLPNQINLVNFLATVKDDIQVSPKRGTKLAMLHLRSLTKLVVMDSENVDNTMDKVIKFIQSTQQSQVLSGNKSLSKELTNLKTVVSKTDYVKKDKVIKQIE
ncbi:MAG: LysM peptidoglycan-binding domain-containing protein, partial [Proteobacteria bacterium]|nr:LysM peptidoglycan-binding domain-containing protein [Pseudomonadota bacterium]